MAQIDCKVENLPDKLFPMIKEEMFKYEQWETLLAPRIILGIWHVGGCTSLMRCCIDCFADLGAFTFR